MFNGKVVLERSDVFGVFNQFRGIDFLVSRPNRAIEMNGAIGHCNANVGKFIVGLAMEKLLNTCSDDFVINVVVGFWFAVFAKATKAAKYRQE